MSGELPKVLYCSFDVVPAPTGSSARALGYIRALEGRAVADGLTLKTPELAHIERVHGMRLLRVPVGLGEIPARALAFERAVRRQFESEEYQLVHFTDPFGGYPICELKRQHNFKVVYEVAGLPSVELRYTHPHLEGDRRFMARLRRLELFCLMNADAVVVGSEQTARMLQGLGVSRDRMAVVPTQVELQPYAKAQIPPPDRTPMRVVYLGGQQTWQGLSTLVFATAVAAKNAPISLAIVGPENPAVRPQLEEAIRHRRLTGLVELLPPVPADELPSFLGQFDLGAAPLEKGERNAVQGAPIGKIAHYLAAGRPVVASDLPIVRELCDERCAAFFKAGEEADLAKRLVELAHDPPRRAAMGARARALASERLGSERGRPQLVELYAGLLGDAKEAFRSPAPPEAGELGEGPTLVGQAGTEGALAQSAAAAQGAPDTEGGRALPRPPAVAAETATRPARLPEQAAASPSLGRLDGPIEVSAEDLEPIAYALATAASGGGPKRGVAPSGERPARAPEPADAPAAPPQSISALAAPTPPGGSTPLSGLPPPEEWAGHLVLGYAPFAVRMPHKGGNALHWVGQAKARTPEEGVGESPKNGRDR